MVFSKKAPQIDKIPSTKNVSVQKVLPYPSSKQDMIPRKVPSDSKVGRPTAVIVFIVLFYLLT